VRIDGKLNIVVEVETGSGTVFVHSAPISRDVFEKYFIVVSKAFSAMMAGGIGVISGPRVAGLMLKKVAIEEGEWDTKDGVQNGLMAEIRRLSNVVMPTDAGWKTVPYQTVIDGNMMDEDDIAEIDNILVFFTCVSAMCRRTDIAPMLKTMLRWGAVTTLQNVTEYAKSLKTSTKGEISENATIVLSPLA
jgi:hypothetical protein